VERWLSAHDEAAPVLDRVLHPAMLSRVAAFVLPGRFRFDGPRVHRGIHSSFFATRPGGTPMTARGRITRVWEHNGHGYVASELAVVDDSDQVIVHLESESIHRLAR